MLSNTTVLNAINSPVRNLNAYVTLYNEDSAVMIKHNGALQSFTIERIPDESKFFGYGICQKANIKLRKDGAAYTLNTDSAFTFTFRVNKELSDNFPVFYMTEKHKDEKTGEISITAYDKLYSLSKHTFSELALTTPYTIRDVAEAVASFMGASTEYINVGTAFSLSYEKGANFEGSETLRDVLDKIAEATQSIYYIGGGATAADGITPEEGNLTFKRLDISGAPVLTIDKAKYIDLDSSTNRRLTTLVSATELGDNISSTTGESGSTQYIRDNPFWDLREDIATLVDNALAAVGGLTINQFECSWRGNFLLELGDKIALVTKENTTVTSYLLNDTVEYNGALSEKSSWHYTDNDNESATNPSSIGEALKQTFAKVDKANKEITLLASDVSDKVEAITQLQLDTEEIKASVNRVEANSQDSIDDINTELETINKKVEASMTSEAVELKIQQEIESGVNKVTTSTGFTFNEEGLTVEKSGKEIKTQIIEDGMTVYKNEEAVLVANNEGVKAEDLHATTYLIIGTNSRFEDYGNGRTGCFWIGG